MKKKEVHGASYIVVVVTMIMMVVVCLEQFLINWQCQLTS